MNEKWLTERFKWLHRHPELGLEAFRSALRDAGIEELKAEVEAQYAVWKDSLK